MESISKKISAFFTSRKLAVTLIILIALLSIIGTHVPQRSQLKPDAYDTWKTNHPGEAQVYETLGLTDIFSSVIFLGTVLLLFINTLFCTKNMLTAAIRKMEVRFHKKEYISRLENHTLVRTSKEPESAISIISSELRAGGYKVSREENRIYAEKNRFGTLGTSIFHICILFIILSSLYGTTGRMEGDMRLVEGQILSEDHGNYMYINEGPFFNEKHRKFSIKLEKFYPVYYDESNTPRGPAGKLGITENGKEIKTDIIYSNHMMAYSGYTFLGNVYGMSPVLAMSDMNGTINDISSIEASDLDGSGRYVTYFSLGNTGLEAGLMVYMTADLTDVAESGNGKQSPIMFLKLFDNGNEIYDGTLRLNDRVRIHDNFLGKDMYLVFYDIKYWSNFYVVKDDGTILVYTGFVLLTLSITVMFFFVPKRIWVEISDDEKKGAAGIHIGGRAERFRSLYEEEYSGLTGRIKERL